MYLKAYSVKCISFLPFFSNISSLFSILLTPVPGTVVFYIAEIRRFKLANVFFNYYFISFSQLNFLLKLMHVHKFIYITHITKYNCRE